MCLDVNGKAIILPRGRPLLTSDFIYAYTYIDTNYKCIRIKWCTVHKWMNVNVCRHLYFVVNISSQFFKAHHQLVRQTEINTFVLTTFIYSLETVKPHHMNGGQKKLQK